MDYYLNVVIKPDAEMRENVLLNKVYSKFHKALNTLNTKNIGASFPKCNIKLGKVLRIHATQNLLEQLQKINWLGGLKGYCELTAITPIPKEVKYRTVARKQSNKTQSKLNRLIKRGTIPSEKIKEYKAKMYQESLDNPYLELQSTSSSQLYRLFIDFGELTEQPIDGTYNQFGLSNTATVPWF